ncbi:DUF4468 domain-containing protein [Spirosoma taeanense]|uniref:DUF4468 domain-containing protein n=1 Tax=Spirosoma taeanense TaxID=2735870 RepID=A0A6M5YD74_9BACT|nr:DUF4468 domain-containing protein [Spirosoma taeanense]QJW91544.1 DUF4468 domain-containing protein [Spirosoma taeanense]
MKKLLSVLFLFSTTVLAQMRLPTSPDGQVQYQEIVRLPDATRPARQVYNQIRSWDEQHYKAGTNAERQYDDRHGILFVRSAFPFGKRLVRYTLTVEARIGRYRATLTDLVAEGDGLSLPVQATSPTVDELSRASTGEIKNKQVVEQIAADQAELYQQIDKACRATLASLKEAMTAPISK